MASVTRRTFAASLAASFAATGIASAAKLRKNNLGFQIYTVRNILTSDPAKLLSDIHAIGYNELEGTADTVAKAWPAIEGSGLKRVSLHLNTKPTDEQFADAKAKGFEYAVIPYIPPDQRGGVAVMKKLAASLQDSGKRAAGHGLKLCYHTHAFEYEPMEGTSPFEILMGETDPKLVQLELDIFWATVAGHDPVEILNKHKGRVPLLHLKDKAKGMVPEAQYNEKVPKELFKEVGNGSLDIPAVLKAADRAGVQHYFVEQDQSPDPLESLRQSYTYLSKQFLRRYVVANDWDQRDSADQVPWDRRRQLSQTAFWVAVFAALALFVWFVTRWSGSTIHYAAATTNNTQKAQYGVSGQVVDAASGRPIPWASLIAHGITGSEFIHTSADYGGSFALVTYPERQKLVVTADGYQPAELKIGPSWYMWNPHGKEQVTVKLSLIRPQ